MTNTSRMTRIGLKTTASVKDLIETAAAIKGVTVTDFILEAVIEKSGLVLQEHHTITLSREGQLALVKILGENTEPTQYMKDLMALPRIQPSHNN
ncbi:type II toxin-antitoxin system TacA family antitoxin [Methyloradius palustris]|uniref:DUF1778 domain-containing protein n=1 Tax=Methyloradius palustris TaxID=2778876 RepID=A0A8E3ZI56_9PROT|nr:DUF1778 domain-containing protein [Methyloradius palustris]BCM26196.1 hypothetical protein ZMTM_24550 [Methyloradius palustris]